MGNKIIRRISLGIGLYLIIAYALIMMFWPEPTDPENMDWEQRQEFNLEQISRLETGRSKAQVLDILGKPDISEAQITDAGVYELLYYRTQHRKADGETTPDECTPLLIRDGTLIGWGTQASERFQHRVQTARINGS